MGTSNCDTAKKGVVVFLDALGTRNLNIEQTKKLCQRKKRFIDDAKELWKRRQGQFLNDTKLKWNLPEPEIATFQDSIIICWSDQELKRDSLPLLFSAGQWLTDAIPLAIGEYDLFLRGTISYGNYIFDISHENVTVIGPAVTDAYNCHDHADWIGLIQTPSCQEGYISLLKIIAEKDNQPLATVIDFYHFLFILYQVPLREKNIFNVSSLEFFSVVWPQMAIRIEEKKSISKILLNKCLSEDPRYKSKYCNTYAFLKWYKDNGKFIPPP